MHVRTTPYIYIYIYIYMEPDFPRCEFPVRKSTNQSIDLIACTFDTVGNLLSRAGFS